MKTTLILILILSLSGCILPYPHYNWKTPVYTGVVTDSDGQTLEGVEIYLVEFPDQKTTSNENGEFILPPVKDFRLTALICPGPCDAIQEILTLKAKTKLGKEGSTQVETCIGHPDSQCNGRIKNVYITVE